MRVIKGEELARLQQRVKDHEEQQRAAALTAMVARVKAEGGTPDEQLRKTIAGFFGINDCTKA